MKKTLIALLASLGVAAAVAEEISLKQAETAVGNWIRLGRDPTGRRSAEIAESRTEVDSGTGVSVHVVRLAGGGFVVTSADDSLSPIMVSVASGDLDTDEANPLWALLRRDAALAFAMPSAASSKKALTGTASGAASNKAAWAELLGGAARNGLAAPKAVSASTTRKAAVGGGTFKAGPLTKTKWGQTTHNGYPLANGGKLCYNYYTPSISSARALAMAPDETGNPISGTYHVHWSYTKHFSGNCPCGCTATATAQLLYAWRHPSSFEHAADFPEKSLSRTFAWRDMRAVPVSDSACRAVGKLTGTVAYKIGANFGKSLTSASLANVRDLLTGTAADGTAGFGFSSAEYFHSGETIPIGNLQRALVPCLDAGFPAIMGIAGAGRHAVVVDGYRLSGSTFQLHLNLGWDGVDDAWYSPPRIPTSEGVFTVCDELLYNVSRTEGPVLVSLHVSNGDGQPVNSFSSTCTPSGAGASAAKKDSCAKGTQVFFVKPGSYTFRVSAGGAAGEASVTIPSGSGIRNQLVPVELSVPSAAPVLVLSSATRRRGGSDYEDELEISLSCETEGASIYYTLDGSEPDPESVVDASGETWPANPSCRPYDGPFRIAGSSATIRAVAVRNGLADGEETESTLTFVETKSRDKFADARKLVGASGAAEFDNSGCGAEPGEPAHSANGNPRPASVWAYWTAPSSGDFTFRLSGIYADDGTAMDTRLAIYTGSSLGTLSLVARNDDISAGEGDYSSRVSFRATAGTVYRIAMDSYLGATYPGSLALRWEEGATDTISLSVSATSVQGGGETRSTDVESSSDWIVEECSDWIEPLAESGASGTAFSYAVSSNETGSVRGGYALLRSGEDGWAMLSLMQGTLPWLTTKAAAVAAAQASGKRILLASGRDTCSNTQYTRFTSCEDDSIHDLLRDGYILWYNNCDLQGSETWAYLSGITGSYSLPLVCVLDPGASAAYLSRTTGLRTAAQLREVLDDAVLFDANGGTVGELVRYIAPGSAYGTLPVPERPGYSFVGWFASETGGTAVTAQTPAPGGASTLHARWTAKTYKIVFDRQSGSGGSSSVTATYGASLPKITVPTRDGYDFGGYWSGQNGTGTQYYTAAGKGARVWDIDAGATLYARWDGQESVISFAFEGGAGGTESVVAEYGEALPTVIPPERQGWVFLGYWTNPNGKGTRYYDENGVSVRAWDRTVATTLLAAWEEVEPVFVYRFYSKAYKGHFFTIDEAEKDTLIKTNPNWKYEGEAYGAFSKRAGGTVPLYRFYSKAYKGHFFTIDEAEMRTVRDTNPNWKFEGVAYYVYPEEVEGSVPVFRFWSKAYRHHFYTIDEAEKNTLIETNPNWKYETVAFWAIPADTVEARRLAWLAIDGPASVASGGSAGFAATATRGDLSSWSADAEWEILSGGDAASISENGVLTAAAVSSPRPVRVKAAFRGREATRTIVVGPSSRANGNYTETVGGIQWSYLVRNNEATVESALGTAIPSSTAGPLEIPSVLGGLPVVAVGYRAFFGCSKLTAAKIPDSILQIGAYAFYECAGLVSADIPGTVTNIDSCAFQHCTALRTAPIPGGVRSLGNCAFGECGKLLDISVPPLAEWIGLSCFSGCSSATSPVRLPLGIDSIQPGVFSGCSGIPSFRIPSSVTHINYDAFYGCSGLKSLSLPSSLAFIGEYAFGSCTGLASIDIPASVETIDSLAFCRCHGLSSVTVPAGVSFLGAGAFANCNNLARIQVEAGNASYKSVDGVIYDKPGTTLVAFPKKKAAQLGTVSVPSGVTAIGPLAFGGCSGMREIKLPATLRSLGDKAFELCSSLSSLSFPDALGTVGEDAFSGCTGLRSVSLPASVGTWGEGAFLRCTGLTSVTFAPGTRTLPVGLLANCTSLASITLPAGVTKIPRSFFYGCTGLKSVSFPAGLVSIDMFAFRDCSGLETLSLPSGLQTIGDYVFCGCSSFKRFVVPASVVSIGSAPWGECWNLASLVLPSRFIGSGNVYGVLDTCTISYYSSASVAALALRGAEQSSGIDMNDGNDEDNDGNDNNDRNDGNDGNNDRNDEDNDENDEIAINAINNGDANGFSSSICASPEVGGVAAPWSLAAWPDCEPVATEGETAICGLVVEASADAPELEDLPGRDGSTSRPLGVDASLMGALPLLLALPDGSWRATLRSAVGGAVADEDATGVFGFTLPANGAWHWLRVRDAGDDSAADAFSLWLRAK